MRRRACSLALGLLLAFKVQAQEVEVIGPPPAESAAPKTEALSQPAAPAEQAPAFSEVFEEGLCDVSGGTRGFWASGEYLLWFHRGIDAPPLVTTSPAGTPFGVAGILGNAGTSVLAADQDFKAASGFRFTLGMTLPSYDGWGIETTWFFLEDQTESRNFASNAAGAPTLGRPFVSAFTGNEAVSYAAFPGPPAGTFAGNVNLEYEAKLWGAEFSLVALDTEDWMPKLSVGFRYLDLEEELNITQTSFVLPGAALLVGGNVVVTNPDGVRVRDAFDTRNQFYGAQVGAKSHLDWGGLFTFDIGAKLALGVTHQSVSVNGQTDVINNIGINAASFNGGLLAVNSNSGRRTREAFSVVPEVNLKANLPVTSGISFFAGYDFIYWSNVAHPGDQIDRNINVTQVPTSATFGLNGGPPVPAPKIESSDFWVHGVNFGLALSF